MERIDKFVLQEGKNISNLRTAYIFKGLGRNLLPFKPNENKLKKMQECIRREVDNSGKNIDVSYDKIGLTLTLKERKLINALTIFIANSTFMNRVQNNTH